MVSPHGYFFSRLQVALFQLSMLMGNVWWQCWSSHWRVRLTMRAAFVLLSLACLGAMLPPFIPRPHKSSAVHQGAGALALISRYPALSSPTTNSFLWQYPPGINPSNFWWNIEVSTDLVHWSVLVSNASGEYADTSVRTNSLRVYRISGRLEP